MEKDMLAQILVAIGELKDEVRHGFEQTNKQLEQIEKHMDSIEADIAILVEESHANKKAIYQLKKTSS